MPYPASPLRDTPTKWSTVVNRKKRTHKYVADLLKVDQGDAGHYVYHIWVSDSGYPRYRLYSVVGPNGFVLKEHGLIPLGACERDVLEERLRSWHPAMKLDLKRVFRGSRKHVLDWVASGDNFVKSLNMMLEPTGASVGATDKWMPRGNADFAEARIGSLREHFLSRCVQDKICNWWLKHGKIANVPNWDFLSTCSFASGPGLVLVEAKAHKNELKAKGKSHDALASKKSRENHEQIGTAIEEACCALRDLGQAVNINRDSHYQLANRVAMTWKLASLHVPVVLVYIGFIGDQEIRDVGRPFQTDEHWLDVFTTHVQHILPKGFTEREIDVGGTPMWMLVRSQRIIELSAPE